MRRIKQALATAKQTIIKGHSKYEYKAILPVSILLIVAGYFIQNTFGNILLLLGLIGSPLFILLEGFWIFVLSLIKP